MYGDEEKNGGMWNPPLILTNDFLQYFAYSKNISRGFQPNLTFLINFFPNLLLLITDFNGIVTKMGNKEPHQLTCND